MNRLAPLVLLVALFAMPASPSAPSYPFERRPRPPRVDGPTDLRFFGSFCLPSPREFCKGSFPLRRCKTLYLMGVHLDHLAAPTGGLLVGGGNFRLDDDDGAISVAGAVLARGWARIAASAEGFGDQLGEATLSADGLALSASLQGRRLTLRKDACGNHRPEVTLTAPGGPSFPFGGSVLLVGTISDEDEHHANGDFPPERLVFSSDRQGVLFGTRTAGGRSLFTTGLLPGSHRLTLTVTDRGGLTGKASVDVVVENHPPLAPHIYLPAAGATLVAGSPVLLQGNAYDADTGFVPDGGLAWSAQFEPGGEFVALGAGEELGTVLATPGDPVRVRLTAVDGAGGSAAAERLVRVVPAADNAPPVVAIREPDRLLSNGPPAGGALAGAPARLVATAWDREDPVAELELRWEFVALDGLGGAADPAPPAPNPPPVTGTLAPEVVFPVPDRYYRVTFRATDTGGLVGSDSIEVRVVGEVIE